MAIPDNTPAWVLIKGTLDPMKTELFNSLAEEKRYINAHISKTLSPMVKIIFQTPTATSLSPAFMSRVSTFNFA
jgi:hypothetical protein